MNTSKIALIGRYNFDEIMSLPCVLSCTKTSTGDVRYKGTFELPEGMEFAEAGCWLILQEGAWVCVRDADAIRKCKRWNNRQLKDYVRYHLNADKYKRKQREYYAAHREEILRKQRESNLKTQARWDASR